MLHAQHATRPAPAATVYTVISACIEYSLSCFACTAAQARHAYEGLQIPSPVTALCLVKPDEVRCVPILILCLLMGCHTPLCLTKLNGGRHILILILCLVWANRVGVDCSDWSLVVIEEFPSLQLAPVCVYNCGSEG